MAKLFIIVFIFILLANPAAAKQAQVAPESDQQINEFSLSGYGEKGKKTWDISGKSADIFTDLIKLNDIIGNLYGEKDTIKLVADRGDFNKVDNNVHLEQNVVVTTSSGAKLTTDSLDWDRNNNLISTKDEVNIERESMITTALGASAEPSLNKVTLEKDVFVQMLPAQSDKQKTKAPGSKIIITCDGQLNIDYDKNIAIFNKNVKVDREGSQIYSDVMDIYFITDKNTDAAKSKGQEGLSAGGSIDKIIAHGNVKIVRGESVSYSEEAIYSAADKKITLTGRPKLIIESMEGFKNVPVGN